MKMQEMDEIIVALDKAMRLEGLSNDQIERVYARLLTEIKK